MSTWSPQEIPLTAKFAGISCFFVLQVQRTSEGALHLHIRHSPPGVTSPASHSGSTR